MRFVLLAILLAALPLRADDLGLKVPAGFRVTLWADHTLANDIFTMALDEKGRVVVSGPGYIRRLEDTKGTGKADRATDIAAPHTGMMGLCYEPLTDGGARLLSSGENELYCETRRNDGRLIDWSHAFQGRWPTNEHGGHAIKLGPDGYAYAIGGNESRISELNYPGQSLPGVEAGGIIRFRTTYILSRELVAHGFRNPYDFDFTPYGDIITWDSDTERDDGLPWYSPTRVYHVMPGAHHGWRLPGWMRSLARPDYYPDTVEILADMGRGSPTGVCCYRHTQFPPHYRGGVFLCDWTFGKIYYMPLIPEGSSYKKVQPEVFLEPTGTNGFAPTAIRVAPDGSLFVSIGGRGTRGAVYRIEYLVDGKHPVIPKAEPESDLDRVLDAPQPLEAWSMAKWMPLARKLTALDYVPIALNEHETDARRIRVIELMVERHERLTDRQIDRLTKSKSPLVRARLAWALGFMGDGYDGHGLRTLADDPDPRVATTAIARIAEYLAAAARPNITPAGSLEGVSIDLLVKWMGQEDRRVRLAAARVIPCLPREWHRILEKTIRDEGTPREIVTLIVGDRWTGRDRFGTFAGHFTLALKAQEKAKSIGEKIDALRGVMLGLDDWNLERPSVELFSAYSLRSAETRRAGYARMLGRQAVANVSADFPATDEQFNLEASRLFAMLEVDDPSILGRVLSQITVTSHPTRDFHYLTVLARLTAKRDADQNARVANALVGLDKKLAERNVQVKQNWPARFTELVGELIRQSPELQPILAARADLVRPGNVLIAAKLTGENRKQAATRFLTTVREHPEFPLPAELIDLLGSLPGDQVRPVFRARWSDRSIRELLVKHLAEKPSPADRTKFLDVLETANGETMKLALAALEKLPRDQSPEHLVPLLARLRQSFSDPKEAAVRKRLIELINRQAGQGFEFLENKTEANALAVKYAPVFEWFEKAYPAEAKKLTTAGEDEEAIRKLLPGVKWQAGDVERGRKLYHDRGCQTCHGGTTRIGPDLAGVSKRLSRDDLLTAIVNPSRDVAPAYRVSNIDTKDGKRISGIVVYESTEALIVQTGAAETKRIAGADIESRLPSRKSLMPDGLLKGMKPQDLADLFAFMNRQ